MGRSVRLIILGLLLLVLMPLAIADRSAGIFLNQYQLNELDLNHPQTSWPDKLAIYFSWYTGHLKNSLPGSSKVPDPADRTQVLKYLFSKTPLWALVLPSEGYYYFRIPTTKGDIGGNLRLNDLSEGVLSYGYYFISNPRGEAKAGFIKSDKNLGITHLFGRLWLIRLGWDWTVFLLPEITTQNPGLTLSPTEEYVAWLRDESGLAFHLIYRNSPKGFFYILDESQHSPKLSLMTQEIWGDSRSGFAFIQDPEAPRKLLVSVMAESVKQNSYFDGPFDQIPAKLVFRDLAYQVYPYLQLGGIDEYGYFCLAKTTRVAVTPYSQVESFTEAQRRLNHCKELAKSGEALRSCMTFDDKQAYHQESPLFDRSGKFLKGEPNKCSYTIPISPK